MRSYRLGHRLLSVLLEILVLVAATAGVLSLIRTGLAGVFSFSAFTTVVTLVLGCLLEYVLHQLGHLLGGKLTGLSLISFCGLSSDRVMEQGKLRNRETLPELELCPVLMTGPEGKVSALYWLCGGLMNLLTAFLALVLLKLRLFEGSPIESFLLALCLSGVWGAIESLLPWVKSSRPTDVSLWISMKGSDGEKSAGSVLMSYLYQLSIGAEPSLDPELTSELIQRSQEEAAALKENEAPAMLEEHLMYRAYEALIWQGRIREASDLMAILYASRDVVPDGFSSVVTSEAVFCLSLLDQEDAKEAVRQLMSDKLVAEMEKKDSEVSARALYAFASHVDSSHHKQEEYRVSARERLLLVPFTGVRNAWLEILQNG